MTTLERLSHYMAYDLKMFGPQGCTEYTIGNNKARRIETLTTGNFYALIKIGYRPMFKPKEDMPVLNLNRPQNLKLIFEQHFDYYDMIDSGEAVEIY